MVEDPDCVATLWRREESAAPKEGDDENPTMRGEFEDMAMAKEKPGGALPCPMPSTGGYFRTFSPYTGATSKSGGKQIKTLAGKFASHVPEGEFTAAEIQNYLLQHGKNPQKAV
uniref:Mitochondrial chaperone BCS1-like ATPase lid domain-containing protein n=1 Tax=Coccidioides posadasii RMSCC 3488 TaxID=454284 RepID=A0A0J6FBS9_COCPO|nr:hypothetical protein CPAG_04046 [Coccidioides posadasii RMSCC 3488]